MDDDKTLYIGINDDLVTITDDVDCLPPDILTMDVQKVSHPSIEVMLANAYADTGREVIRNYSQECEDWLLFND